MGKQNLYGISKSPGADIAETRKLCEGYSAAVERLFRNRKRVTMLQDLLQDDLSAFEYELYQQDLIQTRAQIKEDEENTAYFRWALFQLGDRERAVIEQLYVDGYTWSSLLSETGEAMSAGAIDKARKRGFQQMSQLINEKRAEVAARRLEAEESN